MTKIIIIKKYKCKRCGHTWTPRKDMKPITCAKCRSAYWDIPKIKKHIKNKQKNTEI